MRDNCFTWKGLMSQILWILPTFVGKIPDPDNRLDTENLIFDNLDQLDPAEDRLWMIDRYKSLIIDFVLFSGSQPWQTICPLLPLRRTGTGWWGYRASSQTSVSTSSTWVITNFQYCHGFNSNKSKYYSPRQSDEVCSEDASPKNALRKSEKPLQSLEGILPWQ